MEEPRNPNRRSFLKKCLDCGILISACAGAAAYMIHPTNVTKDPEILVYGPVTSHEIISQQEFQKRLRDPNSGYDEFLQRADNDLDMEDRSIRGPSIEQFPEFLVISMQRTDTNNPLEILVFKRGRTLKELIEGIKKHDKIATRIGNHTNPPYGHIDTRQHWINEDSRRVVRSSYEIEVLNEKAKSYLREIGRLPPR